MIFSPMTFTLTEFQILSNGADGGHHYVMTDVEIKKVKRKLVVLFSNKTDEQKLMHLSTITVTGNLIDEGPDQSLLLLDSYLV